MKRNGFVGCFVPEISGVKKIILLKKTPKVTVPLLYLCKIRVRAAGKRIN